MKACSIHHETWKAAAVAIAVLSLLVNVYFFVCEVCDLWRK